MRAKIIKGNNHVEYRVSFLILSKYFENNIFLLQEMALIFFGKVACDWLTYVLFHSIHLDINRNIFGISKDIYI